MYVVHEDRWLKASFLQSYTSLDKPSVFVTSFFKKYPLAKEQLLAHEDKSYFLSIMQHSGQKPALFIPTLDNNFGGRFKKV